MRSAFNGVVDSASGRERRRAVQVTFGICTKIFRFSCQHHRKKELTITVRQSMDVAAVRVRRLFCKIRALAWKKVRKLEETRRIEETIRRIDREHEAQRRTYDVRIPKEQTRCTKMTTRNKKKPCPGTPQKCSRSYRSTPFRILDRIRIPFDLCKSYWDRRFLSHETAFADCERLCYF